MATSIDPSFNPYTNPNLDADLSNTIGKMRGSRKTINANQFLIKADSAVDGRKNSDTEETTTQDRTRSGATGSGGSNNRRSMSH